MRYRSTLPALLFTACLLALGCGGDDPDPQADPAGSSKDNAPKPGEVVIEPSEATLMFNGEERDTLTLVRELLADEALAVPAGFTVVIDDGFSQDARVRFWAQPAGEADDEAIKAAATETYDALAAAFDQQAESALRGELAAAQKSVVQSLDRFSQLQNELRAFQASQAGLSPTQESRTQRRVFTLKMDQVLEQQSAFQKTVKALERQIDRKRWAKLMRIR